MYFEVEYRSGNHPMIVSRNSETVRPTVMKLIRRLR